MVAVEKRGVGEGRGERRGDVGVEGDEGGGEGELSALLKIRHWRGIARESTHTKISVLLPVKVMYGSQDGPRSRVGTYSFPWQPTSC